MREVSQALNDGVKQKRKLLTLGLLATFVLVLTCHFLHLFLEMVDGQKSSIESDLKQAAQKYSKMSKEIDEKNVIMAKKDVALSEVTLTQNNLSEQLLLARNKIINFL